jgi:hypothetical protein
MNQFSDADVGLRNDPLFNPRYEEQFVLRLPQHLADKMSDPEVAESVEFCWSGEWLCRLALGEAHAWAGQTNEEVL